MAAGKAVPAGEGLRAYYRSKIEELEVQIRDKQHNLKRMEAQRNELNGTGERKREGERGGGGGAAMLLVLVVREREGGQWLARAAPLAAARHPLARPPPFNSLFMLTFADPLL